MKKRGLLSLTLCLGLVACDDDPPPKAEVDQGVADAALMPDAAPVDAAPMPDAAPIDAALPADPAWIEVNLAPRKSLYTLAETPAVEAAVYDRIGALVDGHLVEWTVAPESIGAVVDGALQFSGEGQALVRACVGEVCGEAAVFVDDAEPVLILDQPTRGAALGGDGSATIAVSGTATDTGGDVSVRINGVPVALGEGGVFALDVPATFGVNRVVVTADDGVRSPPVRAVREVLWAPEWSPVEADGAAVANAVSLRLDQGLLDADRPFEVPAEGGELAFDGAAQVLGAVLSLVDVGALLPNPQLVDTEALSLRVESVELGVPEIDLYFTAEGAELFLRLPALTVETRGALQVEGAAVALDGTLSARVSAFATLELGLPEGALTVNVGEVGIAIERIEGNFANPTANVLVGTLGSRLSTIARDLASGLIDTLIREQLPALVESALSDLLGTLAEIPLNLDPNIEGLSPLALTIGIVPSAIELRRREMVAVHLDARVGHPQPVAAPHADPGVATLSPEAPVLIEGQGLGAAVRLELVNALLHEVWRAGFLQIAPPLPDEVSALVRSVALDGRLPPVVAPAPAGSRLPLEVQVGDLRVAMVGRLSDEPDIYAVDLRVGLSVESGEGSFELVVADAPRIEASLVAQGGARAFLTPEQLATLLEGLVWPQVQEALAGGLAFAIPPINVDPAALADIAPRLSGVAITPHFDKRPVVRDGRAELEGGLDVRLMVAPAGE